MNNNEEQFLILASEPCVLGIDPGATNTGWVVIHEESGTVLHSSTVKRPKDMQPFTWAMLCVKTTTDAVSKFNITKVGIEGVEEPNVYHNGKKNMLRPLFLINTAIVAGAYGVEWAYLKPVIVRPSKNGSMPTETYPASLIKRRPPFLDGIKLSGTRNHERSSYDIAVKAMSRYEEGYKYDRTDDVVRGEPKIANGSHSSGTKTSSSVAAKRAPTKKKSVKKVESPQVPDLLSGNIKIR